jgi:hypothetical protein
MIHRVHIPVEAAVVYLVHDVHRLGLVDAAGADGVKECLGGLSSPACAVAQEICNVMARKG